VRPALVALAAAVQDHQYLQQTAQMEAQTLAAVLVVAMTLLQEAQADQAS
jgi:hypothetical protein